MPQTGDRDDTPRIIPAYAGSTAPGWRVLPSRRDHPRIRGEHDRGPSHGLSNRGSSPHTRGAPPLRPIHGRRPRIIPAYAGSTADIIVFRSVAADHPRIRGEHISCSRFVPAVMGSSPHTRGAQRRQPFDVQGGGIIPAYAGSTLGNPCNTKDRRRDYTSFPLPVTHPSGGGGS